MRKEIFEPIEKEKEEKDLMELVKGLNELKKKDQYGFNVIYNFVKVIKVK